MSMVRAKYGVYLEYRKKIEILMHMLNLNDAIDYLAMAMCVGMGTCWGVMIVIFWRELKCTTDSQRSGGRMKRALKWHEDGGKMHFADRGDLLTLIGLPQGGGECGHCLLLGIVLDWKLWSPLLSQYGFYRSVLTVCVTITFCLLSWRPARLCLYCGWCVCVDMVRFIPRWLCRLQLSDAISIIGREDFPAKWPDLITEMVTKIQSGDFHVINGILRTAHSIFKRSVGSSMVVWFTERELISWALCVSVNRVDVKSGC